MDLKGSGAWRPVAACGSLWQPVLPCRNGLDPPNIKISDSGGLDLEAWCLDAWMLEGLEWIGGGDGVSRRRSGFNTHARLVSNCV